MGICKKCKEDKRFRINGICRDCENEYIFNEGDEVKDEDGTKFILTSREAAILNSAAVQSTNKSKTKGKHLNSNEN